MMESLHKTEITPGGFVMLSLLMFFLETDVLAVVVGNVLIHECGHIWMLKRCGVFVRRLTVGITGVCIQCNTAYLSRRGMFVCAAAGPAWGLAVACITSAAGNFFEQELLRLFAGTGVVLSAFNLLPARPLDGWQMLHAAAPQIAFTVGSLTAVCVLCVGLGMMYYGYGTAMAVMGIFLLLQDIRLPRYIGQCRWA